MNIISLKEQKTGARENPETPVMVPHSIKFSSVKETLPLQYRSHQIPTHSRAVMIDAEVIQTKLIGNKALNLSDGKDFNVICF